VIIKGDCIAEMQKMPTDSVDLVFGSPPYEDARTYGIDFKLKGQAWVDWMVAVYIESLRVCKGLVAYVVEGKTRKFSYSGTPLLLAADLLRAGVTLRKPPAFHRSGIPGSGGPDWLRNDYEFIICATNGGRLPWSDSCVMGHPPIYSPGGQMSHRTRAGDRVNEKRMQAVRNSVGAEEIPGGTTGDKSRLQEETILRSELRRGVTGKDAQGFPRECQRQSIGPQDNSEGSVRKMRSATQPARSPFGQESEKQLRFQSDRSLFVVSSERTQEASDVLPMREASKGQGDVRGTLQKVASGVKKGYNPPRLANPGNVIRCNVGGGQMGSRLSHSNEAPFPLALAEFFVRSFCPPGGITLDPFCGSGTTGAAAVKAGREFIGIDVRASQVALTYRRLSEARQQLNLSIEES